MKFLLCLGLCGDTKVASERGATVGVVFRKSLSLGRGLRLSLRAALAFPRAYHFASELAPTAGDMSAAGLAGFLQKDSCGSFSRRRCTPGRRCRSSSRSAWGRARQMCRTALDLDG